ncbi:MAG: hypothetical protein RIB67_04950 [Miltoncostaeaceae bacterium]
MAVLLGAVLLWAPAFVAHHHADSPGGVEVNRARIDQGWQFIIDAVRESRDARLGDDALALEYAQRLWARPSGRAERVELTWLDGPFTVPVPSDGARPAAERRRAEPPSPFGWVVWGMVRGGERQMIGLLDYRSGEVVWDIRPRLRAATAAVRP